MSLAFSHLFETLDQSSLCWITKKKWLEFLDQPLTIPFLHLFWFHSCLFGSFFSRLLGCFFCFLVLGHSPLFLLLSAEILFGTQWSFPSFGPNPFDFVLLVFAVASVALYLCEFWNASSSFCSHR